jgi:MFS family permease
LFWIARFSAVAATMAMVVVVAAQTYLIARREYGYSEAEAAFLIGLLGLAQFLPLLLLTPVAGYVADRFDRRWVAMLANLLDLLVCLVLALANLFDWLSLPLLFVMAAAHGAARVFVGPAMSAIVPNIVPAETLPRGSLPGLRSARSCPMWYRPSSCPRPWRSARSPGRAPR